MYLPCSGTENRQMIFTDLMADNWSRRECFSDCECVVAGDFNAVLDNNNAVSQCLTNFLNDCSLVRCDDLFPSQKAVTYVNVALGHQSQTDYALVSNTNEVCRFAVLEPDVNFSIISHSFLNYRFLILIQVIARRAILIGLRPCHT